MSWEKFKDEPTEDLIAFIQWKDEEGYAESAQDAFYAFCVRFRMDLIHKCRVICNHRGYDKHIADEIAYKTFERFWKYPRFDKDKSNTNNIDTGVKVYLYAIAQNLLKTYKSEESNEKGPYDGSESVVYEFPDLSSLTNGIEKRKELEEKYKIIKKALNRLSEKHKIIYLTYKAHEANGHKLPRKLLLALRDELGLTQNTVRYYKKEAFDKVNEYLEVYG